MIDWNEERKQLVTTLWLSGATAAQVAAAVGEGCTRNAAIGIITRLKLHERHGRPKKPGAGGGPKSTRASRPARPARPGAAARSFVGAVPSDATRLERAEAGLILRTGDVFSPRSAPEGARVVQLEELREGNCKWPLFDTDKPWLFCGAPAERTAEGKARPYCPFHARRAVQR